jgi:cytochrome c oxidase subunit 3
MSIAEPDRRRPPGWQPPFEAPGVGTMGMYMLVLSLGVLFAAGMVAYLAIRSGHEPWPPPEMPALPRSLWLSTLAILAVSVAIQRALGAARRGDQPALKRNLALTLSLGLAFLALQAFAWLRVFDQIGQSPAGMGQFVKLFYVLTGLHALHVLGGLAPLAAVTGRALAGRYAPDRHAGVRYQAIYWHFLDAVWCLMFVVIYW